MQNNYLSPHFSLLEFTESQTAKKYGIDNTPTPEAVANLTRLCHGTLEPLREELGLPEVITSGYRCKALNDIINHHSNRSQHLVGSAADFYVGWSAALGGRGQSIPSNPRERLIKAFRQIITSNRIDYDQLILYPNFIHVSNVSPETNHHYIMVAQSNGRYRHVTLEVAITLK